MADIQLRQQFPAPSDLSFGPDVSEGDLWFRENFPVPPSTLGLSFYPTRWGIEQPATGAATREFTLAATEAQDIASIAMEAGRLFDLDATEAKDVAAVVMRAGRLMALGATEARDVADFSVSVTAGGATRDFVLAATENQDVVSITMSESPAFRGGGTIGGWRKKDWKWVVEWWKPPEEVIEAIEEVVVAKSRAPMPVLEKRVESKTQEWRPSYRQFLESFKEAYTQELEQYREHQKELQELEHETVERIWTEIWTEELKIRRKRTRLRVALLTIH